MTSLLQILAAVWGVLTGSPERCVSTIFGYPGDRWAGGNALLLKRPVNDSDFGVAHRTLPLGSKVLVCRDTCALATVIDRGPYGAMHEGSWVLKRRKSDPGVWRGCLDTTPALAKALKHQGFDKVSVTPIPNYQTDSD